MSDDSGTPLTPQFSLRTMLLVVTMIGVFLGLFWWVSPLAVAGVAMFGLIVAAHVFGNVIGTRLRDGAPRRRESSEGNRFPDDKSARGPLHAPATHLGERWSLGWGIILPTATGAIIGCLGGCFWIEQTYSVGFDVAGLAVAGVAFGVLGGFVAFALASFLQVLAIAIDQAMRHK